MTYVIDLETLGKDELLERQRHYCALTEHARHAATVDGAEKTRGAGEQFGAARRC